MSFSRETKGGMNPHLAVQQGHRLLGSVDNAERVRAIVDRQSNPILSHGPGTVASMRSTRWPRTAVTRKTHSDTVT